MAEIKVSNKTKDRVNACKAYIERKYKMFITQEKEKISDWQQLELILKSLNFTPIEQELIKKEIQHKEAMRLRKKRQKITVDDFESLAIIGRGAFGEVRVCRHRSTNEIVAIKKMKKSEMIFKNQLGHIRAERDLLVQSKCKWIVELKSSFQDDDNLYLVMEFLSGGDLMTLLIKKDIIPERDAKFYIAELVLAIEEIHSMNYIHRDLKPDNILIDAAGHLKISDFGLCKHLGVHYDMAIPYQNNTQDIQSKHYSARRQLAYSTVGTPDYIAPEIFSQKGYDQLVDWWSVGVILFEMVIGYPPFYSDTPQKTCQKILSWKHHFKIPKEQKISSQCQDLILKLISDPSERLGDPSKIKKHPFFCGIDWTNLRNQKPPYLPDKKKLTSNFDKFEEKEPWKHIVHNEKDANQEENKATSENKKYFYGYTYKRNYDAEISPIKRALEELQNIKPSGIKAEFDKKQRSQSPKPINAPPEINKSQRSQSPTVKEQLKTTYMQYIGQYLSPINKLKQKQS
ncbi:unnamed protein product (macronuclear) [Paramecium tetraurelia]|uniref:non-specific serine/threonine protein kinase n=1 Tax=Paramecium tetraurelia TaxID=5888 RepID=A0DVE0_PARTE|nr:uncharacterized protein GSPATT00020671001 [Paramecium tetraurelia]CAK87007.1 unnamed protein product [Paramecium tetraurelia]|eukprot:XP_001454404.1 hypothetical protein (macronuclear) [Paramecium tetraurelia strain d4-2]